MIVAMKKIFVIVEPQDAAKALGELCELGSVHVEHQKLPEGQTVSVLKEEIAKLKALVEHYAPFAIQPQQELESLDEKISVLVEFLEKRNQLKDEMAKRQTLIHFWQPWGDFDPQDLQILGSKGLCVKLYKIPESQLDSLPEDIVCETVFVQEKIAHCVVIAKKEASLAFPEVALPALGLGSMKELQEADTKNVLMIEKELEENGVFLNAFRNSLEKKISDLRLQEALAGMGQSQGLVFLKGFCPSEKFVKLQALARREKWGLIAEDPDDEDRVPTLTKNPKWVELIKPVFGIMNIVPGYKEFDISVFFLLFLSLFFGMLVGDAGYGVIMLLGVVFFHVKNKGKIRDQKILSLMYVFTVCTIIWGTLTGVFFGQGMWPSFKPLVPWLNDERHLQMFCFFIGATHLSIAHVWRAMIKMPSKTALSEAGWIAILWFMFFLAKSLILNQAMPFWAMYLLYTGMFLVVFYHQPGRSFFKTVGSGLGVLALSIVNMFTDVVSYIRLAAVGLASTAVADSFNQMAMGFGFKTLFSGIAVVLILLIGHALNLALGFMAIMVHGVRLNILEFSSHLGMEWSGVSYDPLRKIK